MAEHVDIAIIGGAVMGSALACFLAINPDFDGRLVVLEKDRSFANAASSRSTSGFRQQFSSPVNIALSRFSADFIKHANVHLCCDGEDPGIAVTEHGYLYLGDAALVDAFVANNQAQRALGADVALLDPVELARRFPWLTLDDIAVGSLGLSGEGWLDGYMLMGAFRRRAQAGGAAYRYTEVVSLSLIDDGRFRLGLADGGALIASRVVDTAGTSGPAIAAMLGVQLPVQAVKQNVFAFDSPFRSERMPYLFTPDGLFCRPEGTGYIAGLGIRPQDVGVDLADMQPDYGLFESEVWPRLAFRVAGFAEARFKSAWAGHYDMSMFDHNPFVGAVAGVPGFYLANGFSGHGLMQSPGIGRALSELILYGAYRTLDLSPLGHHRLAAGQRMVERIQY